MELSNFRINYFLITIQLSIILITIYKFLNTPSETYWILTIVLLLLIIILIYSVFGNNILQKKSKSEVLKDNNKINSIKVDDEIKNEEIPERLDDSWDLPI